MCDHIPLSLSMCISPCKYMGIIFLFSLSTYSSEKLVECPDRDSNLYLSLVSGVSDSSFPFSI